MLLFVFLMITSIGWGQIVDVPGVSNHSEISNNFKGQLGSGNFIFDVPLFDIETVNPDFVLKGSLWYNAQAASTVYTSPGTYGNRGFSVDFLPTIHRNIKEESTLWDESYFKVNSADLTDNKRPERTNDLFEFSIYGLRASFRLEYNNDNTIDVIMIDSNGYLEVIPNATIQSGNGDAKIIQLNGFTIKDRDGFTYHFHEKEESVRYESPRYRSSFFEIAEIALDNPGDFNSYIKSFLLSEIIDKYGRVLASYTYKTYPNSISYLGKTKNYQQKAIDEVLINNRAKLTFTTSESTVHGIFIKDLNNTILSSVGFNSSGVAFYGANNELGKRYTFMYYPKPLPDALINNKGNFLKTGNCLDQSVVYNNEVQDYTAGLLKTIILPNKGKIEIDYEINTFGHPQTKYNLLNYKYIEIPVTALSDGSYSFDFHGTVDYNFEAHFIKFQSQFYTDPLLKDENGNPIAFYPEVDIYQLGYSTKIQSFAYENQCTYGEAMNMTSGNGTIIIRPRQYFESYISNVKVYKRVLKSENERVKYLFGPSIRVKKIVSKDFDNSIVKEQIYSYNEPTDSKKSSGKVINGYAWDIGAPLSDFSKYKPLAIIYKYVTIEEVGKGKTIYELNLLQSAYSESSFNEVVFQPVNIWKYNHNEELVEHVNNDFEYFDKPSSMFISKIKRANSTLRTYEGTSFKEVITEKIFDSVSLHMLKNKIIDTSLDQTFEENYTYQKLGDAFYQVGVEKIKNNAPLNRSVSTYQQFNNSLAYDLKKVSVAKETKPLQAESEILRYDDVGNVLEYKTKDGLIISQIWGYNDSRLVAELKNMPYDNIDTTIINNIKLNSNATTYNESALVGFLDDLRDTNTGSYVTTYTYSPLVGVTSITDPNGRQERYLYDDFNRLWRVINHQGLIIKEYTYNIKN